MVHIGQKLSTLHYTLISLVTQLARLKSPMTFGTTKQSEIDPTRENVCVAFVEEKNKKKTVFKTPQYEREKRSSHLSLLDEKP